MNIISRYDLVVFLTILQVTGYGNECIAFYGPSQTELFFHPSTFILEVDLSSAKYSSHASVNKKLFRREEIRREFENFLPPP